MKLSEIWLEDEVMTFEINNLPTVVEALFFKSNSNTQ